MWASIVIAKAGITEIGRKLYEFDDASAMFRPHDMRITVPMNRTVYIVNMESKNIHTLHGIDSSSSSSSPHIMNRVSTEMCVGYVDIDGSPLSTKSRDPLALGAYIGLCVVRCVFFVKAHRWHFV